MALIIAIAIIAIVINYFSFWNH